MKLPFREQPDTAVITCIHILDKKEPILYVSHDEDDGMWQFLCGGSHSNDEARIVSLEEMFLLDNTVGALCELPRGWSAVRESTDEKWIVQQG